tara:strand:- start:45 stop:440 length:396 start_codon:yes stop_codon:yes gene_type:complete
MSSEKQYIVRIEVGNIYDGHCRSDDTYIHSNFTLSKIKKAYNKGIKEVDVDITKFCEEFECDTIPKNVYDKLIKEGYSFGEGNYSDEFDKQVNIYEFVSIWLFIAKKGDNDFKYTYIKDDFNINIGGYGLF